MNKQPAQAGYTLIELMVAVTIVSLLGLLVLGFLTDGSANSLRKITRSDLLREAQAALDIATKDIRYASGAATSNTWPDSNAPGAPGNLLSWQSDGDTLVLSPPATDASGDFLYADAATFLPHKNNLVYFVAGGTLYRRTIAAAVAGNTAVSTCPPATATPSCPADLLVASAVDEFTVTYLDSSNAPVAPSGAHSAKLELGLERVSGAQSIKTSYTIQVVFRNG